MAVCKIMARYGTVVFAKPQVIGSIRVDFSLFSSPNYDYYFFQQSSIDKLPFAILLLNALHVSSSSSCKNTHKHQILQRPVTVN